MESVVSTVESAVKVGPEAPPAVVTASPAEIEAAKSDELVTAVLPPSDPVLDPATATSEPAVVSTATPLESEVTTAPKSFLARIFSIFSSGPKSYSGGDPVEPEAVSVDSKIDRIMREGTSASMSTSDGDGDIVDYSIEVSHPSGDKLKVEFSSTHNDDGVISAIYSPKWGSCRVHVDGTEVKGFRASHTVERLIAHMGQGGKFNF